MDKLALGLAGAAAVRLTGGGDPARGGVPAAAGGPGFAASLAEYEAAATAEEKARIEALLGADLDVPVEIHCVHSPAAQALIDDSRLLGLQLRHTFTVAGDREEITWGGDWARTTPETGGTIHGQFEAEDEITEYGVYVQSRTRISDPPLSFPTSAAVRPTPASSGPSTSGSRHRLACRGVCSTRTTWTG